MEDIRWAWIAAVVTLFAVLVRRRPIGFIPLRRFSIEWLIGAFVMWLALQLLWVMDVDLQLELLDMYVKFAVVIYLIYHCIESEEDLQLFLLSNVLGCLFFGWLASTEYRSGRFEGFGGPGLGEANAAANQLVVGALIGASVFLAGKPVVKCAVAVAMVFIMNGLVTTFSRSGFLGLATGGLVFYWYAPSSARRLVVVASALGLGLFLYVTNSAYWERMGTIKQSGQEIEGTDTGGGRLALIKAQFAMFKDHPMGCGHRCTNLLSQQYVDERYLIGQGAQRGLSSHNTFLSVLVEQGVPGALFYMALAGWTWISIGKLRAKLIGRPGTLPLLLPGVVAAISAVFIGDLFVDFLKHEVRMWLIAILLVMWRLSEEPRPAGDQRAA